MPETGGTPKVRTDLAYYGVVTQVITATQFVAAGLAGLGDGALVGYAAYVLVKADRTITPPHAEQPAVTAYVSASGTITHVAYTAPVAVGDQLIFLHPNISTIPVAWVAAIQTQTDRLAGGSQVGVHVHANNALAQTVFEWAPFTTRRKILSIWLDFVNLTQNTAYILSNSIDGVNYRAFDDILLTPWTPAANDGVLIVWNETIETNFRLEIQSAAPEGFARDVPFRVIYEDMT